MVNWEIRGKLGYTWDTGGCIVNWRRVTKPRPCYVRQEPCQRHQTVSDVPVSRGRISAIHVNTPDRKQTWVSSALLVLLTSQRSRISFSVSERAGMSSSVPESAPESTISQRAGMSVSVAETLSFKIAEAPLALCVEEDCIQD